MKLVRVSRMKKNVGMAVAAFAWLQSALVPVYASDTEVYARTNTLTGVPTPTIMFLLDSSGSMTEADLPASTCDYDAVAMPEYPDVTDAQKTTRFNNLRCGVYKVLMGRGGNPAIPGFMKAGLAVFLPHGAPGGYIVQPARPLDALADLGDVTARVMDGNDDAEQDLPAGSNYLNSDDLDLGKDASTNRSLGLRFQNVVLPRYVKVSRAVLVMTASEAVTGSTGDYQARIDTAGNAVNFVTTAVESHAWSASANSFNIGDIAVGQTTSIDVTALVQDKVNEAAWCGGQAMAFRLGQTSAGNGHRAFYSYENAVAANNPALAPYLSISYTVDLADLQSRGLASSTCFSASGVAAAAINQGYDDISIDDSESGRNIDYASQKTTEVNYGLSFKNRRFVGVRFGNLAIPNNAVIDSATVYGQFNTGANALTTVNPYYYNAGDTAPFCRNYPGSGFYCRVSSSGWNGGASKTVSVINQSGGKPKLGAVDVTSYVQALVGRGDWVTGNSMTFLLVGDANASFYAYENGADKAARIDIKWHANSVNSFNNFKTVRQQLWESLRDLNPDGNTPLATSFAEVSDYMMGYKVWEDASVNTSKARDASGNLTGMYSSPLSETQRCASNFIYMLTDGEPNNDGNASQRTTDLLGGSGTCTRRSSDLSALAGAGNQGSWYCMFDAAKYLSEGVNRKNIAVNTSTVMFGPSIDESASAIATYSNSQKAMLDAKRNLRTVADKFGGRGEFYEATDEDSLVESLQKTVDNALAQNGTISAPGVAVNQLSRLTHLDQLYYAVFDPDPAKARWEGNLKRYRLYLEPDNGDADSVPQAVIKDYSGSTAAASLSAVDPVTGFFAENTKSAWSSSPDGSSAVSGGAAGRLTDVANRKMYTYLGTYPSGSGAALRLFLPGAGGFDDATAKTLMNVSSDVLYRNLINWFKGYNLTQAQVDGSTVATVDPDNVRQRMGGVLHSQPIVVNYGYENASTPGSTADRDARIAAESNPDLQDNTVFVSSMEGLMQAINAKTGNEEFSFIPKELLVGIKKQHDNPNQTLPEFGLDGAWTVWRRDGNGDFRITTSGQDHVYLYGGMRMGGRNFYALDMTNRSAPKVLWGITPSSASAFSRMGQSWSKPVLGTIKVGGAITQALFIGGGYDGKHETAGYSSGSPTAGNDSTATGDAGSDSDYYGNQVYIVNAKTGALIAWASNGGATYNKSEMKFSIPTEMKTRDTNGDGLVDIVYFGDLGGQVFRMDINNGQTATNLIKRVHLLASLGQAQSGATLSQRRFYESSATAPMRDDAGKWYMAVALGSGYRSHPLDEAIQEEFYMLRDYDAVKSDLMSLTTLQGSITRSSLAQVDLTSSSGVSVSASQRGWYIDFTRTGEKVLSTPLIFNAKVFFSTYIPEQTAGTECKPVVGSNRLWAMGVSDAQPLSSGGVAEGGRAGSDSTGLGSDPVLVIQRSPQPPCTSNCENVPPEDNSTLQPVIIQGTGAMAPEDQFTAGMRPLRWYEKKPN